MRQSLITKYQSSFTERATLARRVYEEACDATETFEGALGLTMVYLLGSILRGTYIDLSEEQDQAVLAQLHTIFRDDHPVWHHVKQKEGEQFGY